MWIFGDLFIYFLQGEGLLKVQHPEAQKSRTFLHTREPALTLLDQLPFSVPPSYSGSSINQKKKPLYLITSSCTFMYKKKIYNLM